MDKTKIEWCDSTWNPVTGCYHGCPYCYANSMINRFGDRKYGKSVSMPEVIELTNPIKDESGKRIAYPTGFIPTFHRYRLDDYKDKSGRTIFVCSMADLFGVWVPDRWIEEVFQACQRAPQHRYLFLTKNPGRYGRLKRVFKLPVKNNMWFGTTITSPYKEYFCSGLFNTFLSIEPIMEDFRGFAFEPFLQGVIVGAETGNRKDKVVPKKEWIQWLVENCAAAGKPLFMKDSLIPIVGEENMVRQLPWDYKEEK